MTDLLSVIIPHVGKVGQLRDCCKSFRDSHLIVQDNRVVGSAVDYELIVVTDKPSREVREFLTEHEDIKPILNEEYVGVEKALNMGLRAATGNYLMFLMTDVRLYPGAPLRMRDALSEHPSFGWVALPCAETGFLAGCSMWTREAFNIVGYFDEQFSSGGGPGAFADDDYLRRMWRAGFSPHIVRGDLVQHVISESGSRDMLGPGSLSKRFEVNQQIFRDKWGQEGTNWNLMPECFPPREMFREEWIRSQVEVDESILELGCEENAIWANTPYKVTTLDISKRPDENVNPQVIADAGVLPFKDKSFDVVCCLEVMEHVPDPAQLLQEAIRVARYRVVITVPDEGKWPKALKPFTNPGHLRYYTKESLEKQLKDTPHCVVEIRRAYWRHFGAVITVEERKRKMVYLNLGSFVDVIAGEWENIDILPLRKTIPAVVKFRQADLTQGLPFYPNDSVDLIRASHVIEHLPLEGAKVLLSHCFRALKAGGLLRIAVPDLDIMVRKYKAGDMEYFNKIQPVEYVTAPTDGERFSRLMFSGDYAHRSIFNFNMMRSFLEQAGFRQIFRSAAGFSHSEVMQTETKDQHEEISMYVEAIK